MRQILLGSLFLFGATCVSGQFISTKPPEEYKGYAVNMKYGAAIWTDSMVYYIDGLAAWTSNSIGRWVVATGEINYKPSKGFFLPGENFEDGPAKGLPGSNSASPPIPKDRRFLRKAKWSIML